MIRNQTRATSWVSPRLIEHRAGQRGAAFAGSQLHCQVGPYQLELLAQSSDDGMKLLGLMTTGDAPADHVTIDLFDAASGAIEQSAESSAFGEFELETARPGRWALRVGDDPYAPCVRLWEVLRP